MPRVPMTAILKIGFEPNEQIVVSLLIGTCIRSVSFIGLVVWREKMFTGDGRPDHGISQLALRAGCGSSLTGSSGEITSPGYPNDYTAYLSCTYIIDAGSNLVSLKFEDFSTELNFDFVKVYDKNNIELENLTGEVEWYVVQSATYYRVVFTSDQLESSTGFKATWTASPSALLPASDPFIHGSCPHNLHIKRSPQTGLSFRCLERFNTSSFTECMHKCMQKSACIALEYASLCAHYEIGAGGNSFGEDVWIVG